MSWVCPHQINQECARLKKSCRPLQQGCVMEGKVAFLDNSLDCDDKDSTQKENIRRRKITPHTET